MLQPPTDRITLTPHPSGNLILTIPSAIANAIHLTPDSEIICEISNGAIVLKTQEKTEYTLDELLAGITPENCHSELDWGNPIGQEQW